MYIIDYAIAIIVKNLHSYIIITTNMTCWSGFWIINPHLVNDPNCWSSPHLVNDSDLDD